MKIQLRDFLVYNLNVNDVGFNWKGRLLLTNSKKPNANIATAYVKVSKPLIENSPKDPYQHDKEISEALGLLTIFLSCYWLVNNKNLPEIEYLNSGGFEIDEENISLDNLLFTPLVDSTKPNPMSDNETMEALNKTIPLFEKVLSIIEQGQGHKLDVALIMYYRSLITFDHMEGFVDLITALEALYSNSGADLTYKIALRVSVFTESDQIKRRCLFDYFRKKVYTARSALVHGQDVSLGFTSPYHLHQMKLRTTMKESLLRYIKLASQGKSKKDILDHIDDIALGIKQ